VGFSNIQYLTLGRDKMRELKFRAWVHSESRYEYSENPPSFSFWKFIGYDERDLKTIEQYAGLKDKNGKEIYEGDRVSGYYSIGDNEGTFKSNIVFDEGGFCFEKVDGDWSPNMNEGYCSDIEVIGNINENPELLTGKSNE